MGGEHLKFHCREIIPCLKALFGDPEFKDNLVFAPEQHFTDNERTCRVYNEMHTGDCGGLYRCVTKQTNDLIT